jgi:pimeloyl-ACP methyl ester carboxylesterase
MWQAGAYGYRILGKQTDKTEGRMPKVTTAVIILVALALVSGCATDRGSDLVVGIWEGRLQYPGVEIRIVFRIEKSPVGTLTAFMLTPDQDDREVLANRVVYQDRGLYIEVATVGGAFNGTVLETDNVIEGIWTQARVTQPVLLARVPEIFKRPRPQDPQPPFPYVEEDVTFENPEADARFGASLTIPEEGRPLPAVVLISGGGAQDRDGTMLRHKPFLVLADHLGRNGIAALRYDDRGVGESTGDRSASTTADYASDAAAAVAYLKSRPEIDPGRIGLIGHSEGGLIAPMVAQADGDIALIVMIAAPGLPGDEYNYQYEESVGRAFGMSEEVIAAKRGMQERMYEVLLSDDSAEVAARKIREIMLESDPNTPPSRMEGAIQRFVSPWFRFALAYDPAVNLSELRCPVLALYGEKDIQVPPERNADAVERALRRGGNRDYGVETVPGLNHIFQTSQTGLPDEYGKIDETFSPLALDLITEWILERVN